MTPDEYKGVRKWKGDIMIPVGSQMKNDKGELVEATSFIVDKLEQLLERLEGCIKRSFSR